MKFTASVCAIVALFVMSVYAFANPFVSSDFQAFSNISQTSSHAIPLQIAHRASGRLEVQLSSHRASGRLEIQLAHRASGRIDARLV